MSQTNPVKPFSEPLWKEVEFFPVETASTKPYKVKYRVRFGAVRLVEIASKLRLKAKEILTEEYRGKVSKEQQVKALELELADCLATIRSKDPKPEQEELKQATARKQQITQQLAEMNAGMNEPWVSEYDISVFEQYRRNDPQYIGLLLELLLFPVESPPVNEMIYDIPDWVMKEAMDFFGGSTEESSQNTTESGMPSVSNGTDEKSS